MTITSTFNDLLLHGLARLAFHARVEHQRGAPVFGHYLVPARRTFQLRALAELAHTWPDLVSGRDRFHTPGMVAGQLIAYLEQFDNGHQVDHDAALHQHLRAMASALTGLPAGHP